MKKIYNQLFKHMETEYLGSGLLHRLYKIFLIHPLLYGLRISKNLPVT